MESSYYFKSGRAVSELAIVDTFTKLIFGEENRYSDTELRIIQSLRVTDCNVALDGHREMGVYLRALGVDEMIKLVSRVQAQMVSSRSHQPHRRGTDERYSQPLGI